MGGDAFLAADKAHSLGGCRFDINLMAFDLQNGSESRDHRRHMVRQSRALGHNGGVDVADPPSPLRSQADDPLQEFEAGYVVKPGIRIGKVPPQIPQRQRPEHGIAYGMNRDIGIGMSQETSMMGDLYAAEN
jgi:hypothetical protein